MCQVETNTFLVFLTKIRLNLCRNNTFKTAIQLYDIGILNLIDCEI